MWFGPGEVVAAQQSGRLAGGIIDQVHCTVRYGSVMLANFYHGFHQSSRMEARIVCERARSGSLNGCRRAGANSHSSAKIVVDAGPRHRATLAQQVEAFAPDR